MRRNALGYERHASWRVFFGWTAGKATAIALRAAIYTVVGVGVARLMGVDI